MNCKVCGNDEFYAHQLVRMDIVCNGEGAFISGVHNSPLDIYDTGKPYGPFTCTLCGAEYDELSKTATLSPTAKDDAVKCLWLKLVNMPVHPDTGCLILAEDIGPFHNGDSYDTVRDWFDANYSQGFEALLDLL